MKEQDTGEVDALREENERLRSINQVRDERIRAKAKAEALREAAERAESYIDNNQNDMGEWDRIAFDDLRAAILADHTPDAGKRAEDVETVRECIIDFRERFRLGNYLDVLDLTSKALAALDRIAGKEE